MINSNSILQLQPAFIGSTRVRSKPLIDTFKNVSYKIHPVEVPFQCCNHIPSKVYFPDLKPLKINKLNTEELSIAQHKLDQYSEDLDKLMDEPFVSKHISWFTYFTIAVIILAIIIFIYYKCRRKHPNRISITAGPGYPPQPPPSKAIPVFRRFNFLPRRRQTYRDDPQTEEEDIELQ